MAYSALGFSLADLAITGESAPTATWGGPLTLEVTLQNLGASTIVEPTSLVPATQVEVGPDGSLVPSYYTPSQSDAPDTTVAVYLVPRGRGLASGVQVGVIEAPRGHEVVPRIVELFPAGRLASVATSRPTLADVFAKLTGKGLES